MAAMFIQIDAVLHAWASASSNTGFSAISLRKAGYVEHYDLMGPMCASAGIDFAK
jgi:hypothetical protein